MGILTGARRRALDVAVIGCGTAGPAVALFLAEQGHRVTLFERVAAPSPVGAGIILQPSGQAVLARLGLYEQVVPRATRLDGLRIETSAGRLLARLEYREGRGDSCGVGLHRGLLFQALFRALHAAPIELRLGISVDRVRREQRGRSEIFGVDGESLGAYELVNVADGARSHLRDDDGVGLDKRVTPYRWGALWFVGLDAENRCIPALHQVVEGTERMVGLLPTGRGPRAETHDDGAPPSTADPAHVSLYWSVRGDRAEAIRQSDLTAWKDDVRRLLPSADHVLDQITTGEQLLFARYHDVVMRRWHTRGVVYIGDAAHAMSPQLGQGCNLALLDAMVLGDCIAAHEDVREALEAYSNARRTHLGFYQFATRWLTPFFQSDHAPLGWLRDLFMGVACRVPFVRRQMIEMMSGTMRGLLASSLDLASPVGIVTVRPGS